MTINLDSTIVSIQCPKCGKQLKEKIGRLKRDKHIVCIKCGRMAFDAKQLRSIEAREKSINKELSQLDGKTFTIKL